MDEAIRKLVTARREALSGADDGRRPWDRPLD